MSNRELSEGINLRNLVLESENPFIDSDIYLIIRNKNRHKKCKVRKRTSYRAPIWILFIGG
jgi:hypothetical protein